MRRLAGRFAIWMTFLLACGLAMPAMAQDDEDWEDEEWEEEADDEWDDDEWDDDDFEDEGDGYFTRMGDKALMGLNSLVTWPADPVMGLGKPREEFDELPGGSLAKHTVGFIQGTLLGAYRLCMGPLDILFAPLTPMVMLSPEPRYNLFDVEHDTY